MNEMKSSRHQSILRQMSISLAVGFAVSLFVTFGCHWDLFGEMCSENYIVTDFEGLTADLEKHVFGQHIAEEYVPSVLAQHVSSEPTKALALHFYGPTGTGKNLVTFYIAKNMFREGIKSRFFHYFNGMRDFAHPEKKNDYKEQIKEYVRTATRTCGYNIFVFDEVHKMAPSVLDALVSYLDAKRPMNQIDFRKNIFIFLSNSGAEDLVNLTTTLLENGKKREDITYEDTFHLISEGRLFQTDGFRDSAVKNLISVHIPFLPLEKEHVKKCIKTELKRKKWLATDDALNSIANEMTYVPPEKEKFSSFGCRKVKVKMELYIKDFLSKV